MQLRRPPPPPPGIYPDAADFVLACLDPVPAGRPPAFRLAALPFLARPITRAAAQAAAAQAAAAHQAAAELAAAAAGGCKSKIAAPADNHDTEPRFFAGFGVTGGTRLGPGDRSQGVGAGPGDPVRPGRPEPVSSSGGSGGSGGGSIGAGRAFISSGGGGSSNESCGKGGSKGGGGVAAAATGGGGFVSKCSGDPNSDHNAVAAGGGSGAGAVPAGAGAGGGLGRRAWGWVVQAEGGFWGDEGMEAAFVRQWNRGGRRFGGGGGGGGGSGGGSAAEIGGAGALGTALLGVVRVFARANVLGRVNSLAFVCVSVRARAPARPHTLTQTH